MSINLYQVEPRKNGWKSNRDKILELKKQYREANREKILEQRKQKTTCECGSVQRRDDKSKHLKSKKHQAYVASLSPEAANAS